MLCKYKICLQSMVITQKREHVISRVAHYAWRGQPDRSTSRNLENVRITSIEANDTLMDIWESTLRMKYLFSILTRKAFWNNSWVATWLNKVLECLITINVLIVFQLFNIPEISGKLLTLPFNQKDGVTWKLALIVMLITWSLQHWTWWFL